MNEILAMRYWADPVLSRSCAKVENNEFGAPLHSFSQQLLETMNVYRGYGLAASQVGILKRIFVMQLPEHEKAPIFVCNPVLTLEEGTLIATEGCLSMPNVSLQIKRAKSIVMQYHTPMGEPQEIVLNDLESRIAQHEADHLDGIFFINRVSRQMRRGALREWENEKTLRGWV